MRHGVAHCRSGSEREVHDPEGRPQPFGGFPGDQLTHAGDLERGLFDQFRQLGKIAVPRTTDGRCHHARTGYTHIDHRFRFPDPVERARHEGVVFRGIGKNDQLRTADGALISCQVCRFFDDVTHLTDGIHVDPCLGGGNVHAGADPFRGGQRFGDRIDQHPAAVGESFLDQCTVTADKIDAQFVGGAVKGLCQQHCTIPVQSAAKHGDRCHADPLVDDGDAVHLFQFAAGTDKVLCGVHDLIVHLIRQQSRRGRAAIPEGDAHGDGPDVEALLPDHVQCFKNIFMFGHGAPQILCMVLKISSCMAWISRPFALPSAFMRSMNSVNGTVIV